LSARAKWSTRGTTLRAHDPSFSALHRRVVTRVELLTRRSSPDRSSPYAPEKCPRGATRLRPADAQDDSDYSSSRAGCPAQQERADRMRGACLSESGVVHGTSGSDRSAAQCCDDQHDEKNEYERPDADIHGGILSSLFGLKDRARSYLQAYPRERHVQTREWEVPTPVAPRRCRRRRWF
jgi:hypothetical protein